MNLTVFMKLDSSTPTSWLDVSILTFVSQTEGKEGENIWILRVGKKKKELKMWHVDIKIGKAQIY